MEKPAGPPPGRRAHSAALPRRRRSRRTTVQYDCLPSRARVAAARRVSRDDGEEVVARRRATDGLDRQLGERVALAPRAAP